MPTIKIQTEIKNSIEICFDLARSIDLHMISTQKTNEKAISGVTKGLIGLNQFVTWRANHLGIKWKLTSTISALDRPFYFQDEQIKGVFKKMVHDHFFESKGGSTLMTDVFYFESPFGTLGKLFNNLVLTNYMKSFLLERNTVIKNFAETEKWKLILQN